MVNTRTECQTCGFDMFWIHTKEYEGHVRYSMECVRCQVITEIGLV